MTKDWLNKYTDVFKAVIDVKPDESEFYDSVTPPGSTKGSVTGTIGLWASIHIPAGNGPILVDQHIPLFYTNQADRLHNGNAVSFAVYLGDVDLPAGWSVSSLYPSSGDVFALSLGDARFLDISILTAGDRFVGNHATVGYRFVGIEDNLVYNGVMDISVVPDVETWKTFLLGIFLIGTVMRSRIISRNCNRYFHPIDKYYFLR